MMNSAKILQAANRLLAGEDGSLTELRIHEFNEDEQAHDDQLQERLRREFEDDFEKAARTLTSKFGSPAERGTEDHDAIPLSGVFLHAIWNVKNSVLYAAAAHEDRELPVLLVLGVDT
jgi:hypothetical protein